MNIYNYYKYIEIILNIVNKWKNNIEITADEETILDMLEEYDYIFIEMIDKENERNNK